MTAMSHTCPRRYEGVRPLEEGQDRWEGDRWDATEEEGERKKRAWEEESRARGVEAHGSNHWWRGPGPMPRTCSYCGGLNPKDALALRALGWTVEVAKSYKAYMHPPGYEIGLLEWHANVSAGVDPVEARRAQGEQWTPTPPAKVYFQHFTKDERRALLLGPAKGSAP